MKRLALSLVLSLALCLALSPAPGAGLAFAAPEVQKIVVGVTPFPHKDIMLVVKDLLSKENYDVEIKEFTDYVQPNLALADGALQANFFQHIPYLDNMNQEKDLNLVWIAKVHIEPLGLYSSKITSLDALKKGDTVAVPNDPTNEARALRLLEKHGILKVKEGELVTRRDITENPLNLKIMELEAAQLPRTLVDVTAAVINTNFAGQAGLIPTKDAIIIEGEDSPYANVLVVRADYAESDAAKALVKAIQSPEVKALIESQLVPKGIVAAF